MIIQTHLIEKMQSEQMNRNLSKQRHKQNTVTREPSQQVHSHCNYDTRTSRLKFWKRLIKATAAACCRMPAILRRPSWWRTRGSNVRMCCLRFIRFPTLLHLMETPKQHVFFDKVFLLHPPPARLTSACVYGCLSRFFVTCYDECDKKRWKYL